MPFTVNDFRDLLELLDAHPEWRADLRRQVLTDELLALPATTRELAARLDDRAARIEGALDRLADAQTRTEQRLGELAAAQARTEQRVGELAAAQARTEQRLDELAAAQIRTEQRLGELVETVARMDADFGPRIARLESKVDTMDVKLGALDGQSLEAAYARRAGSYFAPIVRRIRVIDNAQLADLLDDAVDEGRLQPGERDAILNTDLVISGQRRDDRADVYLLVEVSAGIGTGDVTRAADRAALLERLGRPVVPVVAGRTVNDEARALAAERRVLQVLDGRHSS